MNFRKEHYIEGWKVFLLTFFTLGFYQFYWSFYTWKFIKEETNTKISPAWRTISQLMPVVPIALLFYEVLLLVTKLNRRLALLASILLSIMVLSYTNDIRALNIGFIFKFILLLTELTLASTAFTIAQQQINKYLINKVEEPPTTQTIQRKSANKVIFSICVISDLIISIIMLFTEMHDNLYVFVSIIISVIMTFIIIEIYERKGIKHGQ